MEHKRFALGGIIVSLALCLLGLPNLWAQQETSPAKPPDPVVVETVTQWLRGHAIPLKALQAGQGFKDLKPLKETLKDVRIVALGEATHGSREFFQFKHRMLEFLVKEMGFRVFAIEAQYSACLNINHYVLNGEGDRSKALASQGFWTWDTNEVSDLIDWMREYNKTAPTGKKVKFLGYDMQSTTPAIDTISTYLKKVAPELAGLTEAALKPYQVTADAPQKWSPEEKAKNRTRLMELIGILSVNRTPFIRSSSVNEYEEILQQARVVAQFSDAFTGKPLMDPKNPTGSSAAERDRYMAQNLEFIMESEGSGTKVVVWAHNGHISTASWGGGIPAMGSYLRKVYGDAYYAFGFTFQEGSFQSRNMDKASDQYMALQEFTVGPAPEGSVDWYFAQPRIGNYIVNFREAPKTGTVADWLKAPLPMRFIGAGFMKDAPATMYMTPVILRDHFDGLVFVEKTTRARPNPTGIRGPMKPTN
jgi:erythromycin esterase